MAVVTPRQYEGRSARFRSSGNLQEAFTPASAFAARITLIDSSHRDDFRGVSLVSTLVVLTIMGAMGAVVLSSMPFGSDSNDSQVKSVMGEINAPTPAGQAVQGATAEANLGGGPAAANPPSLPSAARTAACRANVGVVEAAISTKHATDGSYPSSIDELVRGHWLDSAPTTAGFQMTLEVVNGQPTGRLVVNGQPGLQGCDNRGTGQ
jgi:hypothetical protein